VSEKPWVSYSYAATCLRLRLPPESGVPAETVSVQPFRWESSAVIAGMPSVLPIARQDRPSSSRSRTTSSRLNTRLGRPTTFPAAERPGCRKACAPGSSPSRTPLRWREFGANRRLVGFFSSVSSDWLVAMNRTPWLGECGQLLIQVEHGAAKPINLPDGNAVELPLGGIGPSGGQGQDGLPWPRRIQCPRTHRHSSNHGGNVLPQFPELHFANSDRWCSHGRTGRNA